MSEFSSTGPVVVQCPHGLDLRIYPRCYLCKPMEFPVYAPPVGCLCPTVWHGIIPPPCPIHNPPTYYPPNTMTGTSSAAPFCGICNGFHIPGFGPCTANYS